MTGQPDAEPIGAPTGAQQSKAPIQPHQAPATPPKPQGTAGSASAGRQADTTPPESRGTADNTSAGQHADKSEQWWYATEGKSRGPVTEAQLRALARAGYFRATDYVFAGYIGDWVRADSVHGLFEDVGGLGEAAPAMPAEVYLPPESTPPLTAVAVKEYAGFWMRLMALAVDWLVLGVASCLAWGGMMRLIPSGVIGDSLEGLLEGTLDIGEVTAALTVIGTYNVLAAAFLWGYYAIFESSRWQATPGKRALGIMVTDARGSRITFWRATARYFASWVSAWLLFVGYFMGAFTEKKQTLHDMIADTIVTYGRQ